MADTVVDLLAEAAARHDRRPALLIKPAFRTRRWRYRAKARREPSSQQVPCPPEPGAGAKRP